jgi:ribosomal protein L20A (L18A)
MTAEIAVLNKNGIALAADSAVSVGQKIFNSANKLFALTKFHPVGIMVYGNAHFMGIPWETIIKYYRQNILKTRQLPKISDYMRDIVDFISTSSLFDVEGEREFVRLFTYRKLLLLVKKIKSEAAKEIRTKGKVTSKETQAIVEKYVRAWLEVQAKEKTYFPAGTRQYLERTYRSEVAGIVEEVMKELPLAKKLLDGLPGTLLDCFGRQASTLSPSGIVVAGFGESEVFPAVSAIRVDGKIRKHLRIVKHSEDAVSHVSSAAIMPFAQREMVDLFMNGTDPGLHAEVMGAVGEALHKIDERIAGCTGLQLEQSVRDQIKKEMVKLQGELRERFQNKQSSEFIDPVLRGVASLPLDELAAMAESLVNLTSFKRRVTHVPESVGGPVDVAVISKGDGFIWIKRKHYFSPELNPHFFRQFAVKEQS